MERGMGTSKPGRERLKNIQILACLTSHMLTGNPWHLGSFTVGNIKGKHSKVWFGIERQHDLLVLLANALLSINISFKYRLTFSQVPFGRWKNSSYHARTEKIWETIAFVHLQIFFVSMSLYLFSLSDMFVSLTLS